MMARRLPLLARRDSLKSMQTAGGRGGSAAGKSGLQTTYSATVQAAARLHTPAAVAKPHLQG